MAKELLLLLFVAATLLAATTNAAPPAVTLVNSTTTETPTAYEMLAQYNFPLGLLPEGVQGYVLRPDGSFEVYLPGDCKFRVAGKYTIDYSSRVAGSIHVGSIGGLEGVKVKVLFAWFSVRKVDRDGDQLTFHVGPMTKSFPVDKLDVSPRCG